MRTSDGDICYVYWSSVEALHGRRVRLDENEEVINVIPFAVPIEDFSKGEVVVKSTGVPMVKRGKAFRTPMSQWCLTLCWYERVRKFGGPMVAFGAPKGKGQCVVCKCADELGVDCAASIKKADVLACKECLTVWHADCASVKLLGEPLHCEDGSWVCAACSAK